MDGSLLWIGQLEKKGKRAMPVLPLALIHRGQCLMLSGRKRFRKRPDFYRAIAIRMFR